MELKPRSSAVFTKYRDLPNGVSESDKSFLIAVKTSRRPEPAQETEIRRTSERDTFWNSIQAGKLALISPMEQIASDVRLSYLTERWYCFGGKLCSYEYPNCRSVALTPLLLQKCVRKERLWRAERAVGGTSTLRL